MIRKRVFALVVATVATLGSTTDAQEQYGLGLALP